MVPDEKALSERHKKIALGVSYSFLSAVFACYTTLVDNLYIQIHEMKIPMSIPILWLALSLIMMPLCYYLEPPEKDPIANSVIFGLLLGFAAYGPLSLA